MALRPPASGPGREDSRSLEERSCGTAVPVARGCDRCDSLVEIAHVTVVLPRLPLPPCRGDVSDKRARCSGVGCGEILEFNRAPASRLAWLKLRAVPKDPSIGWSCT